MLILQAGECGFRAATEASGVLIQFLSQVHHRVHGLNARVAKQQHRVHGFNKRAAAGLCAARAGLPRAAKGARLQRP